MEHLSTIDDLARKRIWRATDALAQRLGLAPIDRAARMAREPLPTAKSVGDLESIAIVAEAVQALAAEVDELRRA
jgi:hypothetical protein